MMMLCHDDAWHGIGYVVGVGKAPGPGAVAAYFGSEQW